MQRHQARAQANSGAGGDHAMGDMAQTGALERQHTPTHAGQAGIEAENANRAGHFPFVRFLFLGWLDRL